MSNHAGHRQHEGLMRQEQGRAIEGLRRCHTVASIPHYCKQGIDVVCYTGGLCSGTVTPVALEFENLEVLTWQMPDVRILPPQSDMGDNTI